jgi:hypothetical protein
MENRKKIIAIVIVIGILLFAVGAGWYWFGSDNGPVKFFSQPDIPDEMNNEDTSPVNVVPIEQSQPQQFSATVVARLFTERFGTFSNEDDFAGVELVRPYITDSFANWFDSGYRQKLRESYPTGNYMGETVKVLDVTMESENSNQAIALVRAQRTIRTNGNDKVSYQTLRLEMVKDGGVWLIDGAYWESL